MRACGERSVVWHQTSYRNVCVEVQRRCVRSVERSRGEVAMEAMNTDGPANSSQRKKQVKRLRGRP